MLPRWHILSGFVLSYILVYFFNFSLIAGALIFLSSIFIDLDHVIVFYLETKSLHPKRFFEWHKKKEYFWKKFSKEEKERYKKDHYFLHGLEFIIALIVLSFLNKLFLWILLGIILHLVLDIIELYIRGFHISYKISQIWLWQRNKTRIQTTTGFKTFNNLN